MRQEEAERKEEGKRGKEGKKDRGREGDKDKRGRGQLGPHPAPTLRGGATLRGEGGGFSRFIKNL